MLETILSYANEHAWARWTLVLFLLAPPVLVSAARGESGFESLDTVLSWLALLLVALALMA